MPAWEPASNQRKNGSRCGAVWAETKPQASKPASRANLCSSTFRLNSKDGIITGYHAGSSRNHEDNNLTQRRKGAKARQAIRIAAKELKEGKERRTADERRYTQIRMIRRSHGITYRFHNYQGTRDPVDGRTVSVAQQSLGAQKQICVHLRPSAVKFCPLFFAFFAFLLRLFRLLVFSLRLCVFA
jgi:hypothetical protein